MLFKKRQWAADTGSGATGLSWTGLLDRTEARREAARTDSRQAAYEALLEPCWDALWRYAYRTTGDAHDAGDLLAETVLDGFRSFDQFRGDTSFVKWMYRVMSTSRIDMLRRAKRHRADSLDALVEQGFSGAAEFSDDSLDPENIIVGTALSEHVQQALRALPEEYRVVVALVDMEQLDYAEVSEVLQIPIGTVRSRLHRARAQLRKLLADYVEPDW